MALLKINTSQRLNKISPLLYGAFFEDINYGGDGGLYAELIANRSFEYYDRDNVIDKHKMCWDALIGTDFSIHTEKPINNVEVGENIRLYREKAGYSRERFSKLMGVSLRFIADVEAGFHLLLHCQIRS